MICPKCGSDKVHRAYIEDGGQGDWCPNCKKSLQKMGYTPIQIKQMEFKKVMDTRHIEAGIKLKANKKIVEETKCKICNEKFSFGEDIYKCPECENFYHSKCWEENNGCNQQGCQEDTHPCPLCGNWIKKNAVKCRFCNEYITEEAVQAKNQLKEAINEAGSALGMALFSIICFGFILGPWALTKGIKALNIIQRYSGNEGKGKAMAAIIISSIVILLNVLGLIGIIAKSGR